MAGEDINLVLRIRAQLGDAMRRHGPDGAARFRRLGGPPTNFLLGVLADGTKRYRWPPPGHPNLADVELRYAEAVPGAAARPFFADA